MEHKVVQMLCGMLLSYNLETALLEALEVKTHISSQEIQAILNRLDFAHNKLHDLKRVPLLMNLLNDLRLFNQNRVDKGHQLVLERLSRL